MKTGKDIRCYVVRRLNPFVDIQQIIETPSGRITTTNGLVCHTEVMEERLNELGRVIYYFRDLDASVRFYEDMVKSCYLHLQHN